MYICSTIMKDMKTLITNENEKLSVTTEFFNQVKSNKKTVWMMLIKYEGKPYMIDVEKTFNS